MKAFVFLLHVMNAGGGETVVVLEETITQEHCFYLMEEWQPTLDEFSVVECRPERRE